MKSLSLLLSFSLFGCLETKVNVDIDGDEDGLVNSQEEEAGTDPENPDTDGDGHLDGAEVLSGTDPIDAEDHPYMGGYDIDRCDPEASPTGHAVGQVAEDFALTDQFGETVYLSDFCGKVVLLEASAFW